MDAQDITFHLSTSDRRITLGVPFSKRAGVTSLLLIFKETYLAPVLNVVANSQPFLASWRLPN